MHRIYQTLFLALCLSATSLSAQSYTYQHSTLPCLNKKFTIVTHIFSDSLGNFNITAGDVTAAVAQMNKYFAPICVSFEVCEFQYHPNFQHDTLDNPTETAEIQKLHHEDYRINLYLVEWYDENGPVHCGFCNGSINDAFTGGIVIKKGCFSGDVLAHEMGHFFSLGHTFEGNGAENVDGSNCTTEGDGLCDTPADPFTDGDPMDQYIDDDCRFIFGGVDANGDYYNPDLGNIMSYYECAKCGFTWEQLNKMAQAYLNAGVKLW